MANAVEVVKRAAVEAVEAGKPVHILFGTVVSAAPLKIQVDQKSIYTSKMLILTRNVTDFEVTAAVKNIGKAEDAYSDKRIYKVYNALQVGESVLLLRVQRGKKFVVIDRVKEREG